METTGEGSWSYGELQSICQSVILTTSENPLWNSSNVFSVESAYFKSHLRAAERSRRISPGIQRTNHGQGKEVFSASWLLPFQNDVTKCIFQGKGEVETFWLSTRNDINQLSIDGKLISTMLYEIQFSSMPKWTRPSTEDCCDRGSSLL